MRSSPAQAVLEFLGLSRNNRDALTTLKELSSRQSQRLLQWLYDTGLVFYFLGRIKEAKAETLLPENIISSVERDFAVNQRRVLDMSRRFDSLNRMFNGEGVRYAVLKGFSLVPEFCPHADFRHQSDFDYLVDERSLIRAQEGLVKSGYRLKPPCSRNEFIFFLPAMPEPSRGPEQFHARAAHTVELHLDIWDSEQYRLRSIQKLFFTEATKIQEWNGLAFPAFGAEDAFLVQVLHACHHLFSYWIKMSSLFEIGYFLNRRHSDEALWRGIEARVAGNSMLQDFIVIIAELTSTLFNVPLPGVVRLWGERTRPAVRVWIDAYAQKWALGGLPAYEFSIFPTAKLVLFLQQQYRDESIPNHLLRERMLPLTRFRRILTSVKQRPSQLFERRWWNHNIPIQRSLFHCLAGLRYLYEIPRWHWRNRTRLRSLSVGG